jgi:hypothetical protein
MAGRLATAAAALPIGLLVASSAAATTVKAADGVLRYRAHAGETAHIALDVTATHFRVLTQPTPDLGAECSMKPGPSGAEVFCPLGGGNQNYRVSLSDGDDSVRVLTSRLFGTIYSGLGDDEVDGGQRVFGGSGNDRLNGTYVYGGPGDDDIVIDRDAESSPLHTLRGGPGNDRIDAAGSTYGGPGDDRLKDLDLGPGVNRLVGGPGRDRVTLVTGGSEDIVRVRGGGRDTIRCAQAPPRFDVLIVDGSDRVSPRCRSARILRSGRPLDL